MAGCALYLALTQEAALGQALAGAITVIAVFVLRIAAIRYGWQTRAPAGFAPESDASPG